MTMSFNVRCNGKLHKIYLHSNGKLYLSGHHKHLEEAAQTMIALGSPVPKCHDIRHAWYRSKMLPEEIKMFPKHWVKLHTLIHNSSGCFRVLRRLKSKKNINLYDASTVNLTSSIEPRSVEHRNEVINLIASELKQRGHKVSIKPAKASSDTNYFYLDQPGEITHIDKKSIYCTFSRYQDYNLNMSYLGEYYVSAIHKDIPVNLMATALEVKQIHQRFDLSCSNTADAINKDRLKANARMVHLLNKRNVNEIGLSISANQTGRHGRGVFYPQVHLTMPVLDNTALITLTNAIQKVIEQDMPHKFGIDRLDNFKTYLDRNSR